MTRSNEAAVQGYQRWIADEVLARAVHVGRDAEGDHHTMQAVDLDGRSIRIAITRED
jgi:hypothetical protein